MMSTQAKKYRLSVPASILLFGEYFITQAQSKALCMAINKRAYLTVTFDESVSDGAHVDVNYGDIEYLDRSHIDTKHLYAKAKNRTTQHNASTRPYSPYANLKIKSIFANTTHTWQEPYACTMFAIADRLFTSYSKDYATANTLSLMPSKAMQITAIIDTSSFFTNSKTKVSANTSANTAQQNNKNSTSSSKLGIGSSEASAILFCALVLMLNNIDPLSCINTLASQASQTHFEWQGNKGSGYGVYTSIYGGMGIYTKLAQSIWQPIAPPVEIYFYLFNNQHTVASSNAIAKFQQWQTNSPTDAQTMQYTVRQHIDSLNKVTNTQSFIEWLSIAKYIGLVLGKAIGENAETPKYLDAFCVAQEKQEHMWKSTGAGNENAVGLFAQALNVLHNEEATLWQVQAVSPIQIDEGLAWH